MNMGRICCMPEMDEARQGHRRNAPRNDRETLCCYNPGVINKRSSHA